MERILPIYFKKAADAIWRHQKKIHNILQSLSTYSSIQYEIESAIHTLQNAEKEIQRECPNLINKMSVYHSSNVLLYSYVLYGIIPSVYCKEIVIRPSTWVKEQTLAIHELLQSELFLPIKMSPISQRKFTENAFNSEAIVFTGRYENSVGLREHFKESVFLFFGSGTNPMIIAKNVNMKNVISAAIKGRMINSGQDCLCHNVIFVDESVAQDFLQELVAAVKQLRFGQNTDPDADYGPIFYEGVIESVANFWQKNQDLCVYRNRICVENKIVDPLIFVSTIDEIVSLEEFFAPVFYVVTYSNNRQLEDWLLEADQLRKAMALSIFGEVDLSPFVNRYYSVSYDKAFFENESGNEPFGGFGVEASYVYHRGTVSSRPLLISREISKAYGQSKEDFYLTA
jgi:aldehyde dehydrogenase (NAD+)